MSTTIRYQIYRHQDKEMPGETGDVYIASRGTHRDAERWIESQKDQFYDSTWYYIKTVKYGSSESYKKEEVS